MLTMSTTTPNTSLQTSPPRSTLSLLTTNTISATDQSSILQGLGDLQRQTQQLSLLMNQLPEHLRTPGPPPAIRPHPATVPNYFSGPPDLINDESYPTPMRAPSVQATFQPVSPILSSIVNGPPPFEPMLSPPHRPSPADLPSYASTKSHVTTPDSGQRIHIAKHQAVDRLPFTRAYLPCTLPVRVLFIGRYQHARTPGFRGQVT
jgi:hypothetical protein